MFTKTYLQSIKQQQSQKSCKKILHAFKLLNTSTDGSTIIVYITNFTPSPATKLITYPSPSLFYSGSALEMSGDQNIVVGIDYKIQSNSNSLTTKVRYILPKLNYLGSDCTHISTVILLSNSSKSSHGITDPISRHQLCLL
jgi:hypothetical protein